jgi:hypothetical protein
MSVNYLALEFLSKSVTLNFLLTAEISSVSAAILSDRILFSSLSPVMTSLSLAFSFFRS